MLLTVLY